MESNPNLWGRMMMRKGARTSHGTQFKFEGTDDDEERCKEVIWNTIQIGDDV